MRSNKWMLMRCFCRKLCAADNSCVCSLLCQINAVVVFPALFIVLEHWCLAGLDRGVSKQQIKGLLWYCSGWGLFISPLGSGGACGLPSPADQERKVWHDGVEVVKVVIDHFADPCWGEGERGLHHFITNQSSLRFRRCLDSHSGSRWSDCQSFLVLSSRCSVQGTDRLQTGLGALGSSCIWPQEGHTWSPASLPLDAHRFQVLGSLRAGIKHVSCSIRALEFGGGFVSAENEDSALVYIWFLPCCKFRVQSLSVSHLGWENNAD